MISDILVGDYSYSFQGSQIHKFYIYHLLFFLGECSCRKEFPSETLKHFQQLLWRTGTTPILEKNAPRMHGQMKIFHAGSHQVRESLQELLRELYRTSRETPFREWDFPFRELFSELRELLREYPGTLPELREWPFRSESFFPEIGGGSQTSELQLYDLIVFEFCCDDFEKNGNFG